jgi:hypothetical protein
VAGSSTDASGSNSSSSGNNHGNNAGNNERKITPQMQAFKECHKAGAMSGHKNREICENTPGLCRLEVVVPKRGRPKTTLVGPFGEIASFCMQKMGGSEQKGSAEKKRAKRVMRGMRQYLWQATQYHMTATKKAMDHLASKVNKLSGRTSKPAELRRAKAELQRLEKLVKKNAREMKRLNALAEVPVTKRIRQANRRLVHSAP